MQLSGVLRGWYDIYWIKGARTDGPKHNILSTSLTALPGYRFLKVSKVMTLMPCRAGFYEGDPRPQYRRTSFLFSYILLRYSFGRSAARGN